MNIKKWVGSGRGVGGQGGCEKKKKKLGGGGGVGQVGGGVGFRGVRVDVNGEVKFKENSKKKWGGGVGLGGGLWVVRVDVNGEVKFQ